MGCIYQAKNRINGKLYVGQTITALAQRIRCHKCEATRGSSYAFHAAIRKYGFDAFEWVVLKDNLDGSDLDVYEKAIISRLKTISPNGYNLRSGGNVNRILSESTRKKMSDSAKKRFESEDLRKQLSEKTKKRFESPEARAALSRCAKKQFESQEARDLAAQKTRQYFENNPEARKRCGDATRGKKRSPEAVAKMVATNTGRKMAEETKEKLRQKAIGRGHTVETRKRLSEAAKNQKNRTPPPNHKGAIRPEETKRKMSEAQFMRVYLKKAKQREQLMPTCFV